MTAHTSKLTITPDAVERFARYYLGRGERWGIFFLAFEEKHYDVEVRVVAETAEERELASYFDRLTPSQRKRLGQKAEDKAAELRMVGVPGARQLEAEVVK